MIPFSVCKIMNIVTEGYC